MDTIKDKISRFYSLIENYKEGAPDTRYKSWEWCHEYFFENKDHNDENTKDIMALHLAFYLASWGMYRGSSFLLQRDYKTHKQAIDIILEQKYNSLWNYNPKDYNAIKQASELIFGNDGAYRKIKESYKDAKASDTLVTKILMGTFGCIPAFDRFFKRGISVCFGNNEYNGYKITQSIDNANTINGMSTFMALSYFVKDNEQDFKIKGHNEYSPMKCLDMYLWETGYELDLLDVLQKKSNGNIDTARSKAIKLGFASENDDNSVFIEQIKQANGIK